MPNEFLSDFFFLFHHFYMTTFLQFGVLIVMTSLICDGLIWY